MDVAPDIPGHAVSGVLGTGGFAVAYRGWQRAAGREVAIKVDNRDWRRSWPWTTGPASRQRRWPWRP